MGIEIRPNRLFVSGGSRLSRNASILWRELGSLLAEDDRLIVMTGGLDHKESAPEGQSSDRTITLGMEEVLKKRKVRIEDHIETYLSDVHATEGVVIPFRSGKVFSLDKLSQQSGCFKMVNECDVVITIEGEIGTRSVVDMALAVKRPILPLPFVDGDSPTDNNSSHRAWVEQRREILKWFRIEDETAEHLENTNLSDLTESELGHLAITIRDCLNRGFVQPCFVIMPFGKEYDPVYDDAIRLALERARFYPWRTDRQSPVGEVNPMIRTGIELCEFAIADTTGDRPNVMYELGMAHAFNKPVILLRQLNKSGRMPRVPFDFQSHQIIGYRLDDLGELLRRLTEAIGKIARGPALNSLDNR
jgi:hypothetical protein